MSTTRATLQKAITEYGLQPIFREALAELDAEDKRLARARRGLERLRGRAPELPGSLAELRETFDEKFRGLAADSPEFGTLLRQVVTQFRVYLVRLCDGGRPLPHARIPLSLAG